MGNSLNPDFSVYHLISRERQASIILSERRTMSLISHRLEKRLLEENLQGQLFAGFQKVSFFEKRRATYSKLAAKYKPIYVFAQMDIPFEPIEGLHIIPLQDDFQLLNEWFLIFHSRHYFTALCAEEINTSERQFKAIWTFDPEMVQILAEWLLGALGSRGFEDAFAIDWEAHHRIMDQNIADLLAVMDEEKPPVQTQGIALALSAAD